MRCEGKDTLYVLWCWYPEGFYRSDVINDEWLLVKKPKPLVDT